MEGIIQGFTKPIGTIGAGLKVDFELSKLFYDVCLLSPFGKAKEERNGRCVACCWYENV